MKTIVKSNTIHWWIFLLRGLLFILLGIYMLSSPLRSYMALSFLFGLIIILAGIAELVHAFANRHVKSWIWHLLVGIIDLVLGFILVSHLAVTMSILPFIVGIWFLF